MSKIRETAVAGLFYPDDATKLQTMIDAFLAAAKSNGSQPKAIIAPHAGYIYSGPIAASAYAHIVPYGQYIKRVILLGPAHRVYVKGLAASSVDVFQTPLGQVHIDKTALAAILSLPQVQLLDAAHAQEHSLEVHLPFLQTVCEDFQIVPLVVGEATTAEVAEVLETIWGGEETLIVVSSDLSHFLDYEAACEIDRATAVAIEQLNPSRIDRDSACGRIPIRGLLQVATHKGLQVETVDLRNSGDTAGSRDRVVGYGAFIFTQTDFPRLQFLQL